MAVLEVKAPLQREAATRGHGQQVIRMFVFNRASGSFHVS